MAHSQTISKSKYIYVLIPVLVILAGGYIALHTLRKPATQPDVEIGKAVAEQFLNNLRSGNAGKAWDSSTAEFKSIEGRESFIRKVNSTPLLKEQLQFNSSQQVMIQDEHRSEYLFQSAKAKMVRVLIGNERGTWKVDRLTI
ncbi:MAG: hypothetical protein U0805_03100 [Pirellulales bacterium]